MISARHWIVTGETRRNCFIEGFSLDVECPYRFGSYQYKEFMNGRSKRGGYSDFPNWNCVYKKSTDMYKFYELGFKQRQ